MELTERFVSPCDPPTPEQREAAEVLIEECAEVQQRATKLLRFGIEEIQPGQPHNNAYRLSLEVGDLLETIELALSAGILTHEGIEEGREHKRKQFSKYLQHPKEEA
jgi:hypothetical protein